MVRLAMVIMELCLKLVRTILLRKGASKMPEATAFEIGSVVMLNSDGPPMTVVDRIYTADDAKTLKKYECKWFANRSDLRSELFPVGTVKPYPSPVANPKPPVDPPAPPVTPDPKPAV